jgi:hypothetical protein
MKYIYFELLMYFKISTFILNFYNFNGFEPIDRILLAIGIPLAFLWLGIGIGMVRYMFTFLYR